MIQITHDSQLGTLTMLQVKLKLVNLQTLTAFSLKRLFTLVFMKSSCSLKWAKAKICLTMIHGVTRLQ